MNVARSFVAVLIAVSLACVLQPMASAQGTDAAPATFRVAIQRGLGFVLPDIVQQEHWLQDDYPNTKIVFTKLSGGSAVATAMISGNIDLGVLGTPGFLIGWSRGVDWKLLTAASATNHLLNTMDPKIKTLHDIKPGMKIALVDPESTQAMILKKAAMDQLGSANALDSNIITISQPDSLVALLNGQVTAHLGTPPFQYIELDKGAHTILKGSDVFGWPYSQNASVMMTSFYDKYPKFVEDLFKYLERASDMVRTNPERAALDEARAEGKPQFAATYKKYFMRPDNDYTIVLQKFLDFANFMRKIGILSKVPQTIKEIEFSPLQKYGGD